MNVKKTAAVVSSALLILLPGCAFKRPAEPPSAEDVFFDVADAMLEIFDSMSSSAEESMSEKRRKWQCENLSPKELNDLGVTK